MTTPSSPFFHDPKIVARDILNRTPIDEARLWLDVQNDGFAKAFTNALMDFVLENFAHEVVSIPSPLSIFSKSSQSISKAEREVKHLLFGLSFLSPVQIFDAALLLKEKIYRIQKQQKFTKEKDQDNASKVLARLFIAAEDHPFYSDQYKNILITAAAFGQGEIHDPKMNTHRDRFRQFTPNQRLAQKHAEIKAEASRLNLKDNLEKSLDLNLDDKKCSSKSKL